MGMLFLVCFFWACLKFLVFLEFCKHCNSRTMIFMYSTDVPDVPSPSFLPMTDPVQVLIIN